MAEAMTEKDKQILEHLEQAQRLDVPLTGTVPLTASS